MKIKIRGKLNRHSAVVDLKEMPVDRYFFQEDRFLHATGKAVIICRHIPTLSGGTFKRVTLEPLYEA